MIQSKLKLKQIKEFTKSNLNHELLLDIPLSRGDIDIRSQLYLSDTFILKIRNGRARVCSKCISRSFSIGILVLSVDCLRSLEEIVD